MCSLALSDGRLPFVMRFCQKTCVSSTTPIVYSLSIALSSNPNVFFGLPSGVLYIRNHSLITPMYPGITFSTSPMSSSFSANGSSVEMQTTFQSVSPSSIIAKQPNTFTFTIAPVSKICVPISIASIGSLSPIAPVSSVLWLGSSHVCGKQP